MLIEICITALSLTLCIIQFYPVLYLLPTETCGSVHTQHTTFSKQESIGIDLHDNILRSQTFMSTDLRSFLFYDEEWFTNIQFMERALVLQVLLLQIKHRTMIIKNRGQVLLLLILHKRNYCKSINYEEIQIKQ